MNYSEELTKAMTWLGQKSDTIFLGQSVLYPGNAVYKTLQGVPREKLVELPVAEELQMGISLGLALTGKTVISIYPRFDFLLCAMNQLVNHLDKLEDFTHGEYKARVIVRVGVGSTSPLYPGVQHCGDYSNALRKMLKMEVINLLYPAEILSVYEEVYRLGISAVIVEEMERYGME
jgi:pyruvate/2-oxoglutarate/acetoin dehydrogenase E1 component